MKRFSAAVSAAAILAASQVSAEPLSFEFSQLGWSNGGVFSGSFEAEDLNNDGMITFSRFQLDDFGSEVTSFSGDFLGSNGDLITSFGIDDIVGGFPPIQVFSVAQQFEGVAPVSNDDRPDTFFETDFPIGLAGGLTFALDGSGRLGDTASPIREGLSLRNEDFSLRVGISEGFVACGGDGLCGDFASVSFETNSDGLQVGPPVFETQAVIGTPIIVTGPVADPNGNFESAPILPDSIDGTTFNFDLSDIQNLPGRITFFDPDIAIGYTYEVVGNTFAAVQGPTLDTVNDPDGYEVIVDGQRYRLTPGPDGLLRFSDLGLTDVTKFQIVGINPDLGLLPTDGGAFVTGIAFTNSTGAGQSLTQTAIVQPSAVPLPAGGVLLITGVAGFAMLRRRRQNA